MSVAVLYARAEQGMSAPLVSIEIHISNGLPGFSIVGLAQNALKEAKERVRSAIINSRFDWPARRITVNMAPADLPKGGGRFDLGIAVGILMASGQLKCHGIANFELIGELGLGGELRGVNGLLPVAISCAEDNRKLIVPAESIAQAAWVNGLLLYGARHLLEVVAHLREDKILEAATPIEPQTKSCQLSLKEVKGQALAKRALMIAASGGHHILFSGPPGVGKSMLANRLPGLLPMMTKHEALEVAMIHSIKGLAIDQAFFYHRPFRQPHHSSSHVAMIGGGAMPKPGEISLAHRGVLFLDEAPEFDRRVLEVLREPLESGRVMVSRALYTAEFPAQIQLVVAMNPCPCGYAGQFNQVCQCSPNMVRRYLSKISGPLLDRIDIRLNLTAPSFKDLTDPQPSNQQSEELFSQVSSVYQRQMERQGCLNSQLTAKMQHKICQLDGQAQRFIRALGVKLNLSARAYFRMLKVARTLADWDQAHHIKEGHLSEAMMLQKSRD